MNQSLLAIALLVVATSAGATTTGVLLPNPPRSAATRAPANQETGKSMADDSSGLRKGTLEVVDLARSTFRVYGQELAFDAAKVRVFGRDGKATNIYALHRGANVRFTLDASDPKHRRAAVIYID